MSEKTVTRKRKKWGKVAEYSYTVRSATFDEDTQKLITKEIKNAKGLTPETFADKTGLKVSIAKKILDEEVAKGNLNLLHKGPITSVYSK